jgi:hypothetical protein
VRIKVITENLMDDAAGTLISDFQNPELWNTNFCCLSHPWYLLQQSKMTRTSILFDPYPPTPCFTSPQCWPEAQSPLLCAQWEGLLWSGLFTSAWQRWRSPGWQAAAALDPSPAGRWKLWGGREKMSQEEADQCRTPGWVLLEWLAASSDIQPQTKNSLQSLV